LHPPDLPGGGVEPELSEGKTSEIHTPSGEGKWERKMRMAVDRYPGTNYKRDQENIYRSAELGDEESIT